MIVGIEGPVLAGKTSVATAVQEFLAGSGLDCRVAPCFVVAARLAGLELPPASPSTPSLQRTALSFFLDLDRQRRPPDTPDVLLLDRTCWTLEAHTVALARIGAVDATDALGDPDVLARLHALRPDTLLYRDVSPAAQSLRAPSRGPLPYPLLDRRFNAAFRAVSRQRQREHSAEWIAADAPLATVVSRVAERIARLVTEQR